MPTCVATGVLAYIYLDSTTMNVATAISTDKSNHPYAGLENADTNLASWFDPQDVDDTEDFESDSDWRKTHKQTFWKYLDSQH